MKRALTRSVISGAFRQGWRALLREECVTGKNIETIAHNLLKGIIDAALHGETNAHVLATAGVHFAKRKDGQGRARANNVSPHTLH